MKKLLFLSFLVLSVLLTGCGAKEVTVTDREGNEVIVPTKIERIISTAPSNSEVLLGLGLGEKIVGVDKYTSEHAELDENVTRFNFREPDVEVLIGLEPDIIFASGHNKAGDEDPFALIKEAGIPVVYLPSSASIEEIYKDIEFIASITSTEKKGDKIVEDMKVEIEAIKAIASTITDKKSVYLEISPAPWIYTTGTGTFQHEMIKLIGAENVFASEEGWISASEESIIANNPEVIVTNVNGETTVSDLIARDGWNVIEAIQNNNVYQIDSNPSSRPSQNVIIAIKQLAEAVYPELYDFE
ncbi:ABC transporter substrate-binding protein [Mycoplasmatota bacterium WC44]